MKQDWRKDEPEFYLAKKTIKQITIPNWSYLTISGKGSPASEHFQKVIETLFSLSYTLKFSSKKGYLIDNFNEYSVYPLEGYWDLSDEGKTKTTMDKNDLIYTMMIRQPSFIRAKDLQWAIDFNQAKKPDLLYQEVHLEMLEDGPCVQMLHLGSYDDEPRSFSIMKQYILDNGLCQSLMAHKEIYLSDFRKVSPDKLKTVLRYFIENAE
ncbi:MAG: GyrI-like domain-containing protein [Erysipelotrichaceae bacterium]